MTFDADRIEEFLGIFDDASDLIRGMPGCVSLELLREVHAPNVMMTLSVWASEEALESYRASDLFRETWSRTKTLFIKRPEAWSFTRLRATSDS